MQIPLISNIIKYFRIYWEYTGFRLFNLLAIIFVSGCTEGFGIALFIPILTKAQITADSSDKLSVFFCRLFDFFSITPSIFMLFGFILSVFLMRGILKFAEGAYTAYLTAHITDSVRKHIVRLFGTMSYRYFIDHDTGFFTNLITIESSRAVAAFGRFCNVLIYIITISIFIGASFWINWQFTLATIAFAAAVLYVFKSYSLRTKKYSMSISTEYAALHSMLIQSLHSFKYIKATASYVTLEKKLFSIISKLAGLQHKSMIQGSALGAVSEPLIVFFIIGLMLYQVAVIKESLAPLVVSIMFFYRISQYVMGLQQEYQYFSSFVGSVETISRASLEIENHHEHWGAAHLTQFQSSITLKNVSFAYSTKEILHDLTIHIKKNTTVAFVGESGAGKTTLVDLITGVLVPQCGTILIDETPLQEIIIQGWRSRIGYVIQEPVLFNDTVAHNISFWAGDSQDMQCSDKIKAAAMKAYCDYFIQELPDKYQTMIGDRGVKLSVGQRQRLAIARELFKNPELLILDEATSALDTESESYIQKSIYELKGSMTVILIAHRLSTIRNADYIYVLGAGSIVEEGTFQALMEKTDSKFRRMCELQNLHTL
ncbi:MAG: ABC transporter ATP-binding protein [Pseudomonadota bacterium]